jgi:hypothetical protein
VGLSGDRDWPTSAAFADLDDDGDLDLFVCHYLAWDDGNPRPLAVAANRAAGSGVQSTLPPDPGFSISR